MVIHIELWQLFLILSMVFLIIEMFYPVMFFLNFALACLVTASVAVYLPNITALIIIAVALSAWFLWLLRPILMEKMRSNRTGVEDKYIGKVVKVIEPINANGGAITIYGERWNAKANEEIPAGDDVKIIKNDGLVFYVQKV
ncbi:NfeD family protein [bacterium]|nr:NfeD family protein [bacterium]